ncbi:hypothetical protein [Amphibacillus sediminis]|uniref:hypothetical protein n=1 Tax=Amphibacillus sediminis TaxID=360185 RepID=UPI000836F63E|nr:hypothetical protein [Amphibacillus sediminis]
MKTKIKKYFKKSYELSYVTSDSTKVKIDKASKESPEKQARKQQPIHKKVFMVLRFAGMAGVW